MSPRDCAAGCECPDRFGLAESRPPPARSLVVPEGKGAGVGDLSFTQCGFVRVSANPGIVSEQVTPSLAIEVLQKMIALPEHRFLPDAVDLGALAAEERALFGSLHGHRQITDLYLLLLAIHNDARLVTFDRRIEYLIEPEGRMSAHLEVIRGG